MATLTVKCGPAVSSVVYPTREEAEEMLGKIHEGWEDRYGWEHVERVESCVGTMGVVPVYFAEVTE